MRTRILFSLVGLLLGAARCCGDLIASYDFTGSPGDQLSEAADFAITGVSAGALTRGSGVSASSGADSINASAWTTASSIDANDYFGFTLTPQMGATMTLTRISFAERRSSQGIRNFQIRSSLDSFGAVIVGTTSVVPDDSDTRQQSFTLGAAFADQGGAITFRIYGYASESSAGTWRLANYDGSLGGSSGGLTVDGTVAAVPESSAAVAGTVAGLGVIASAAVRQGVGRRRRALRRARA